MKKFFTLSFDDGVEQDKTILDLLRKYSIPATFNINSGMFSCCKSLEYSGVNSIRDLPHVTPVCDSDRGIVDLIRIPEDEIKQVYDGYELATHAPRHERLTDYTNSQISELLLADKNKLETLSSLPVTGHALPYGASDERVCSQLESLGFEYARGVNNSCGKGTERFEIPLYRYDFCPTCWQTDDDIDSLLNEFLSIQDSARNLMFYMWGHSYEIDFYSMKKRRFLYTFEKMLDTVACRDDIIKCTNSELFKFQEEI